jgi:hypothetical protein
LSFLNLEVNKITYPGAVAIGEALKVNASLNTLYLGSSHDNPSWSRANSH